MFIIRNRILPFPRFDAVNLCGVLLVHKGVNLTKEIINHERIHTAQIIEMGIIGFYVWYLIEWVVRLFMHGNAYRQLKFEREAYQNQDNLEYLKHRKPYAWMRLKDRNKK